MKCNFPFLCNNNNSIFKKIDFNEFSPPPPKIISNANSIFNNLPPQNFNIWNKYQNLYNQIISKEKPNLNPFQTKTKNILEFKTSLNKVKVILNEDLNIEKESNNLNNKESKLNSNENSLLGKKRKKLKIYVVNKSGSTNDESLSKKSLRGRKKKIEIIKGNHTKFSGDNIMRKIKCHFLNNVYKILNKSIINQNNTFCKLDNFVNENLKKDYNIKLMRLTFKEIYLNSEISSKYKKFEKDKNKRIIEKIYSEKNEIEAIKILDKTYIELFNTLIKSDLDNFCNEILEKEEKNGLPKIESANYLKEIKNLCENYEEWFLNKKGRKEKKINKIFSTSKN